VGVMVLLFVGEPRVKRPGEKPQTAMSVFTTNMPTVCKILRIKTFMVIIGQGVFGTVPWYSFSFLAMWLELSCFTNGQAANIVMLFGFGQAIAGLFGGKLLDAVSKRCPGHGPPWLAMLSVGIGLPTPPRTGGASNGAEVVTFAAVFLLFGLLISWCGIINQKIFADIVPQAIFSYVYAVDRTIEGTVGALGTPAVGVLTDRVFHYNQTAAQTGSCSPHDARSLGNGVFTVCAVTWTVCFCFFILLHCTYPSDRRRMMQEVVPGKGAPMCGPAKADASDDEVLIQ